MRPESETSLVSCRNRKLETKEGNDGILLLEEYKRVFREKFPKRATPPFPVILSKSHLPFFRSWDNENSLHVTLPHLPHQPCPNPPEKFLVNRRHLVYNRSNLPRPLHREVDIRRWTRGRALVAAIGGFPQT